MLQLCCTRVLLEGCICREASVALDEVSVSEKSRTCVIPTYPLVPRYEWTWAAPFSDDAYIGIAV